MAQGSMRPDGFSHSKGRPGFRSLQDRKQFDMRGEHHPGTSIISHVSNYKWHKIMQQNKEQKCTLLPESSLSNMLATVSGSLRNIRHWQMLR